MQVWQDLTEKQPAYRLDKSFYDKVRAASSQRAPVDRFVIPPYSGRGFMVKKGQTFRVIEETGPQIGDVAFWNAHNPRECFSAMRSWLVEGWVIRPYTRLWSELPWFRPMMTCVEDTVGPETEGEYHHHFSGVHGSAESNERNFGIAGTNACRLNLLQAIEPFGLTEEHLYTNINVHEKDRLDPKTGQRSITRGDGKPGDYVEFYAEMDLVVGVSVCPFGDGSATPMMYGEGVVRPLAVETYDTGIEPRAFPAWTNWRSS